MNFGIVIRMVSCLIDEVHEQVVAVVVVAPPYSPTSSLDLAMLSHSPRTSPLQAPQPAPLSLDHHLALLGSIIDLLGGHHLLPDQPLGS